MTAGATASDGTRRRLFGVVVALGLILAVELAARGVLWVRHGSPEREYTQYGYAPAPLLGFEMIPNVRDRALEGLRTTYSTNELGLRGTRSYGVKTADEIRVAMLGGSCVFGFAASDDTTTASAFLERRLAKLAPAVHWQVINAGHPGYVSYQVLARFHLRIADLEPDVVVLYLGWNDLFFSSHDLPFQPNAFYGHRHVLAMDSWQAYIASENRSAPAWARPWALTLLVRNALPSARGEEAVHPADPRARRLGIGAEVRRGIHDQLRANLGALVALVRQRGAVPMLVTLFSESDLYGDDRAELNGIIAQVARDTDAVLVDADRIVRARRPDGLNDPYDRYHLTDRGNAFLAKLVSDAVIEVVTTAR